MNKDYIRGFFDGDGYVTGSPRKYRVLHITNTDIDLLERISGYLSKIGVENRIRIHNSQDKNPKHSICYRLFITGYKNISLYGNEIGFGSKKNKRKYKALMKMYTESIRKFPNWPTRNI